MDLSIFYSFRTFSLPCSEGMCRSEGLPPCRTPMEWEELFQPISANKHCSTTTLLCGKNGTKEARRRARGNIGGGVLEEVTVIPCIDCDDLLTWTAWGSCTGRGQAIEGMKCRQRGNDLLGFEKEKIKTGKPTQCCSLLNCIPIFARCTICIDSANPLY